MSPDDAPTEVTPLTLRPRVSQRRLRVSLAAIVTATVCLFISLKWNRVVAEEGDLQWMEESSGVYHAHITLPLDYNNKSTGNVIVALAKIPAWNEAEKLGSIILNPGGPGGSGTAWIYTAGSLVSEIVEGRYDIVGFDPRGVNRTSPRFRCVEGNERLKERFRANPLLSEHGADDATYGRLLGQLRFHGQACSANEEGSYISTALVANDLLHISQALGDPIVNYWGISYGSVIGNVFAQMYPESVGRMIIDGVIDAPHYFSGEISRDFVNADDVLQGFYDGCEASPNCRLNGTAREIRETIEDLMQDLKTNPRIVVEGEYSGLVSYSSFKWSFFLIMQEPTMWKAFADATADLLNGDATAFYATYVHNDGDLLDTDDAALGILCGDAAMTEVMKGPGSVTDLEEQLSEIAELSPFWYEMWASKKCLSYTIEPVMLFDGNFQLVDANMLLIGNTYDPLTALSSARKMAQFYTNGVILQQDGYGHTSFAQRSSCTQSAVRHWFLQGELPANNTMCPADYGLFEDELVL